MKINWNRILEILTKNIGLHRKGEMSAEISIVYIGIFFEF
jgi:hypothetical protein